MLDDTCEWFWDAAPIITYTTRVILGSNFRYQNLETNYRILIKCARDYIALKLFRNNVTMKENKIQNFYIQFNGAWIEIHLHTCHQAKIAICCQTPQVAPIASKICTWGFLNMLNLNVLLDLLSDHSSNTSSK